VEDPDICFQVPYIHVLGLCLDFTNMEYSKENVTGCVDLGAKVAGVQVVKIHLGCFDIPLLLANPGMPQMVTLKRATPLIGGSCHAKRAPNTVQIASAEHF
jgi:hypothetical protein